MHTRIAGVGSYVPHHRITNTSIYRAIPDPTGRWSPESIQRLFALETRAFLWPLDEERGCTVRPREGEPATGVDMGALALRDALAHANVDAAQLDLLIVVTGTADQPDFCFEAVSLHKRIGMRRDAQAFTINSGCGGTPYVMHTCKQLMASGMRNIAVVAWNLHSPLLKREVHALFVEPEPGKKLGAFMSAYLFGDAASAIILQRSETPGIVASMSGTDYKELVLRRGGGVASMPYHEGVSLVDYVYTVAGHDVADEYPERMKDCFTDVFGQRPELRSQVARYYLHQPNRNSLFRFTRGAGIPDERVACNVHRIGNTSAAGTLLLLAEDIARGTVCLGSGTPICIAAIGANEHYGAQLILL
jgi:3-oxoacyl-[acyl-carrier-protein] synthase III